MGEIPRVVRRRRSKKKTQVVDDSPLDEVLSEQVAIPVEKKEPAEPKESVKSSAAVSVSGRVTRILNIRTNLRVAVLSSTVRGIGVLNCPIPEGVRIGDTVEVTVKG